MYITNKSQYSDFYNIHWSMKCKKSNQDNMHNHLWPISTFGRLKLSAGNMLICTNSNSQMSCILNNLTVCSGITGICLLNLRSSLFHIKCILKKMCILCILQCSHGSSNIVTMTWSTWCYNWCIKLGLITDTLRILFMSMLRIDYLLTSNNNQLNIDYKY